MALGCALLMTILLNGCGSAPYTPPAQPTTGNRVTQGSADALVELAGVAGPEESSALWLAAADALYAESRPADASSALDKLDPALLNAEQTFDYGALATQLAIDRFDGPAARAFYANLLPLNPAQDQRYIVLAKDLQALNVDPISAASALINSPQPRSSKAMQERVDQIWSLVSQSAASQVAQQANSTAGIERSWWQLKETLLGAFTLTDAKERLGRWQSANATHPARQTVPTALAALQTNRDDFKHIALLIPQSGPLAAAGKAVRDGFVAAHLHAGSSDRQLTVLDTHSASLPDLLAQANGLGADLLVGPLDKNRVVELNAVTNSATNSAAEGQPRIPTLLLNYLPDDVVADDNIVQFGLAVEDEARAIARRIQAENLERVVVLHNEQEWSQRAKDALITEFESARLQPEALLRGAPSSQVVGVGATPDVKQITSVVGNTLLVDASSARHRRLENLLGEELEFVPRARQDIDAIVAFLDGPEARALRPALRFHFSSKVPVYTSSQALRRIAQRDLRDLRGFNVSEIPWKLYPSAIKEIVESSFGVTQGGLVPLYALGVDAYRLADRLDLLLRTPHQRLLGGTGELSIEFGGRVRRDLAWQYVGSEGLTPLPMVVQERPVAPGPR